MTESSRLRFDLYSWGTLTVVLGGTVAYFSFHLAWNLILLSFLLVYFGAISGVAGFTERGESRDSGHDLWLTIPCKTLK